MQHERSYATREPVDLTGYPELAMVVADTLANINRAGLRYHRNYHQTLAPCVVLLPCDGPELKTKLELASGMAIQLTTWDPAHKLTFTNVSEYCNDRVGGSPRLPIVPNNSPEWYMLPRDRDGLMTFALKASIGTVITSYSQIPSNVISMAYKLGITNQLVAQCIKNPFWEANGIIPLLAGSGLSNGINQTAAAMCSPRSKLRPSQCSQSTRVYLLVNIVVDCMRSFGLSYEHTDALVSRYMAAWCDPTNPTNVHIDESEIRTKLIPNYGLIADELSKYHASMRVVIARLNHSIKQMREVFTNDAFVVAGHEELAVHGQRHSFDLPQESAWAMRTIEIYKDPVYLFERLAVLGHVVAMNQIAKMLIPEEKSTTTSQRTTTMWKPEEKSTSVLLYLKINDTSSDKVYDALKQTVDKPADYTLINDCASDGKTSVTLAIRPVTWYTHQVIAAIHYTSNAHLDAKTLDCRWSRYSLVPIIESLRAISKPICASVYVNILRYWAGLTTCINKTETTPALLASALKLSLHAGIELDPTVKLLAYGELTISNSDVFWSECKLALGDKVQRCANDDHLAVWTIYTRVYIMLHQRNIPLSIKNIAACLTVSKVGSGAPIGTVDCKDIHAPLRVQSQKQHSKRHQKGIRNLFDKCTALCRNKTDIGAYLCQSLESIYFNQPVWSPSQVLGWHDIMHPPVFQDVDSTEQCLGTRSFPIGVMHSESSTYRFIYIDDCSLHLEPISYIKSGTAWYHRDFQMKWNSLLPVVVPVSPRVLMPPPAPVLLSSLSSAPSLPKLPSLPSPPPTVPSPAPIILQVNTKRRRIELNAVVCNLD